MDGVTMEHSRASWQPLSVRTAYRGRLYLGRQRMKCTFTIGKQRQAVTLSSREVQRELANYNTEG